MLGDYSIHPTIAVSDITRAREFYEDVLGLKIEKEMEPREVLYASGDGHLGIYESKAAGTNKATYALWEVDNIEAVVEDLKAKGVTFEHYDDLPDTTRDGDLHFIGEAKAAWFTDPDGNYLCLSDEK